MSKKSILLLCVGTLALLAMSNPAGAAAGDLTYGGDLRVRESIFDRTPLTADITAPNLFKDGAWERYDFIRVRPRAWAQYSITDNMNLRAQITNEFRIYRSPSDDYDNAWEFPDEWFIDNLYLDVKGLAGGDLDLRIGRQNMIYGTGKLILDGTPGDGSRTIYFDAVKATWKGFTDMTVDVFGIYDFAENPLVVNGQDRNLTNYSRRDVENESDEIGVGLYLKHKGMQEGWPFEAYYLMKQELEYASPGIDVETATINTIGVRLMPQLTDSMTGNLEIAYQMGSMGDTDISGYMIDAKLSWPCKLMPEWKGKASAGFYLLSGDDPDTADDEAWTPAFSRWPQYSESYIYSMVLYPGSVADWQNVMMPYIEVGAKPHAKVSSTMLLGYMMAPQADPVTDESARGILFTWWNKYTLKTGLITDKDKLAGHILIEVVKPGSFHASDDLAKWLRWEFLYSF